VVSTGKVTFSVLTTVLCWAQEKWKCLSLVWPHWLECWTSPLGLKAEVLAPWVLFHNCNQASSPPGDATSFFL
jgi:hypothetical protein